jgi:glycosyltransferase involved in cell wall biosynthesis
MKPDEGPLSVCMLSEDFIPAATGVGSHLQSVTAALAARGHSVTVITTRRPGEPEHEVWKGVSVQRVRTIKLFGFYQAVASSATLRRLLAEARPDIVHCHYLGFMLMLAVPLIRALGCPHIYTYHMTEDHLTQPLPMRPLRGWIARRITAYCNRVDMVISVSRNLAAQLPGRGIKAPIRFISNPVDLPDPAVVEPSPRGPGVVVMFAGRLNPEKNIPFLLRAFQRMSERYHLAQLWIAGHGSQRIKLEQQVADAGLSDRVVFLGFLDRNELSRRYAACDVFVLPSWVETQGLVAMEAMQFGKPIIVSRSVVSADELVDEGRNGYIVEADDDELLAERLLRLACDPDLRGRLGAAGKEKSAGYSPERILDELERAYRDALRSRRGAPQQATLARTS